MFKFLFDKSQHFDNPVKVDVHSHLLPGLDDGVKSFEEAIEILKSLEHLGYEKIVTTPHIMREFYDNDSANIAEGFEMLSQKMTEEGLKIKLEFAAEYFLDEFFLEKLEKKEQLLYFGDKYVLAETSFYNAPVFLKDAFFQLNAQGYKPVFAHPERYIYLQQNDALLDELNNMQVFFQVNLASLGGHYGTPAKKLALKMIEKNYIHFIGSDCHNLNHLEILKKTIKSKKYQSLPFGNLLNNTLLKP